MDPNAVIIERGSALTYGGNLLALTGGSLPNVLDCEMERAYGPAFRSYLHTQTASRTGEVYFVATSKVDAADIGIDSLTGVLFMLDDESLPLRGLLFKALQEADRLELRQLTIPMLRGSNDPLAHILDQQHIQSLEHIGLALADFVLQYQAKYLTEIRVFVGNDFAEAIAVQNAFDLALAAHRTSTEGAHK